MSHLPDFIPVIKPMQPILTYGDELSSADITQLQSQINTLSYHPTIVVLPLRYHVKDGDALVSELAKSWSLGPHEMLIVYSPADKNVWSASGSFYANNGGDPGFFKHDFSQRMSMDSRGGNLCSTLDSCLQDINAVANRAPSIPRAQSVSKAQSTTNVINGRQTRQSQTAGHRGHIHGVHTTAAPISQIFPAVFAALVILVLIGRALGPAPSRKRYDDTAGKVDALSSDVDRILRVMNNSQDSGTGGSGSLRVQNRQIPMSEFKKRAGVAGQGSATATPQLKTQTTGAAGFRGVESGASSRRDDSATNLQSAIDTSAAKVRLEHKQKLAYEATYAPQASSASEENSGVTPIVQDGAFIDSYVATFDIEPATVKPQPEPVAQILASAAAGGKTAMAMSSSEEPSHALQVFEAAQVSQLNQSSQPSAVPFADILSSMGTPLGDMKTNAGASLPLGSMDSFGAVTSKDAAQTVIPCPKCSELKMKDFSFCLKCGHNF